MYTKAPDLGNLEFNIVFFQEYFIHIWMFLWENMFFAWFVFLLSFSYILYVVQQFVFQNIF